MQLLVVRHGETQFNCESRYLGALDPVLTRQGFSQAEQLRDRLKGAFDAVFCSPLRRARQTAEVICSGTNLEPLQLPWLRERNVGVFEGLTQSEAKQHFPELWELNITRQWSSAPPGGETIDEVVLRVSDGLARLQFAHMNVRGVLVCHGFLAKVIRALCGSGFEDFFEWELPNGCVLDLGATGFFNLQQRHPIGSAAPLARMRSISPGGA